MAVLKNVLVMANVKMGHAFVMSSVDGEDLIVKFQAAQGLERIAVDMVVAIVRTECVFVIQVYDYNNQIQE